MKGSKKEQNYLEIYNKKKRSQSRSSVTSPAKATRISQKSRSPVIKQKPSENQKFESPEARENNHPSMNYSPIYGDEGEPSEIKKIDLDLNEFPDDQIETFGCPDDPKSGKRDQLLKSDADLGAILNRFEEMDGSGGGGNPMVPGASGISGVENSYKEHKIDQPAPQNVFLQSLVDFGQPPQLTKGFDTPSLHQNHANASALPFYQDNSATAEENKGTFLDVQEQGGLTNPSSFGLMATPAGSIQRWGLSPGFDASQLARESQGTHPRKNRPKNVQRSIPRGKTNKESPLVANTKRTPIQSSSKRRGHRSPGKGKHGAQNNTAKSNSRTVKGRHKGKLNQQKNKTVQKKNLCPDHHDCECPESCHYSKSAVSGRIIKNRHKICGSHHHTPKKNSRNNSRVSKRTGSAGSSGAKRGGSAFKKTPGNKKESSQRLYSKVPVYNVLQYNRKVRGGIKKIIKMRKWRLRHGFDSIHKVKALKPRKSTQNLEKGGKEDYKDHQRSSVDQHDFNQYEEAPEFNSQSNECPAEVLEPQLISSDLNSRNFSGGLGGLGPISRIENSPQNETRGINPSFHQNRNVSKNFSGLEIRNNFLEGVSPQPQLEGGGLLAEITGPGESAVSKFLVGITTEENNPSKNHSRCINESSRDLPHLMNDEGPRNTTIASFNPDHQEGRYLHTEEDLSTKTRKRNTGDQSSPKKINQQNLEICSKRGEDKFEKSKTRKKVGLTRNEESGDKTEDKEDKVYTQSKTPQKYRFPQEQFLKPQFRIDDLNENLLESCGDDLFSLDDMDPVTSPAKKGLPPNQREDNPKMDKDNLYQNEIDFDFEEPNAQEIGYEDQKSRDSEEEVQEQAESSASRSHRRQNAVNEIMQIKNDMLVQGAQIIQTLAGKRLQDSINSILKYLVGCESQKNQMSSTNQEPTDELEEDQFNELNQDKLVLVFVLDSIFEKYSEIRNFEFFKSFLMLQSNKEESEADQEQDETFVNQRESLNSPPRGKKREDFQLYLSPNQLPSDDLMDRSSSEEDTNKNEDSEDVYEALHVDSDPTSKVMKLKVKTTRKGSRAVKSQQQKSEMPISITINQNSSLSLVGFENRPGALSSGVGHSGSEGHSRARGDSTINRTRSSRVSNGHIKGLLTVVLMMDKIEKFNKFFIFQNLKKRDQSISQVKTRSLTSGATQQGRTDQNPSTSNGDLQEALRYRNKGTTSLLPTTVTTRRIGDKAHVGEAMVDELIKESLRESELSKTLAHRSRKELEKVKRMSQYEVLRGEILKIFSKRDKRRSSHSQSSQCASRGRLPGISRESSHSTLYHKNSKHQDSRLLVRRSSLRGTPIGYSEEKAHQCESLIVGDGGDRSGVEEGDVRYHTIATQTEQSRNESDKNIENNRDAEQISLQKSRKNLEHRKKKPKIIQQKSTNRINFGRHPEKESRVNKRNSKKDKSSQTDNIEDSVPNAEEEYLKGKVSSLRRKNQNKSTNFNNRKRLKKNDTPLCERGRGPQITIVHKKTQITQTHYHQPKGHHQHLKVSDKASEYHPRPSRSPVCQYCKTRRVSLDKNSPQRTTKQNQEKMNKNHLIYIKRSPEDFERSDISGSIHNHIERSSLISGGSRTDSTENHRRRVGETGFNLRSKLDRYKKKINLIGSRKGSGHKRRTSFTSSMLQRTPIVFQKVNSTLKTAFGDLGPRPERNKQKFRESISTSLIDKDTKKTSFYTKGIDQEDIQRQDYNSIPTRINPYLISEYQKHRNLDRGPKGLNCVQYPKQQMVRKSPKKLNNFRKASKERGLWKYGSLRGRSSWGKINELESKLRTNKIKIRDLEKSRNSTSEKIQSFLLEHSKDWQESDSHLELDYKNRKRSFYEPKRNSLRTSFKLEGRKSSIKDLSHLSGKGNPRLEDEYQRIVRTSEILNKSRPSFGNDDANYHSIVRLSSKFNSEDRRNLRNSVEYHQRKSSVWDSSEENNQFSLNFRNKALNRKSTKAQLFALRESMDLHENDEAVRELKRRFKSRDRRLQSTSKERNIYSGLGESNGPPSSNYISIVSRVESKKKGRGRKERIKKSSMRKVKNKNSFNGKDSSQRLLLSQAEDLRKNSPTKKINKALYSRKKSKQSVLKSNLTEIYSDLKAKKSKNNRVRESSKGLSSILDGFRLKERNPTESVINDHSQLLLKPQPFFKSRPSELRGPKLRPKKKAKEKNIRGSLTKSLLMNSEQCHFRHFMDSSKAKRFCENYMSGIGKRANINLFRQRYGHKNKNSLF